MTDQDPNLKRDKGKTRWTRIVLFASLATNLLVIGVVAGALIAGHDDRDRTALRGLGYKPFMSALPREDRRALREALERDADSFRDNRMELRAQFEAFLAALRADPFDASEVRRLFSEQRNRITERQFLGQSYLLDRIATMSARERAAYADALDRKLERRSRK